LHFSLPVKSDRQPRTAGQAYKCVLPTAKKLDRLARLNMIVSQQGVDLKGMSPQWEFFFSLPNRRAKLICEWVQPWDETEDNYSAPRIEATVTPFPPMDSRLRQLVRDGHLLHEQLIVMWRQEYKRLPNLPSRFRDSDAALADFTQQGLDVTLTEFSLSTGQSPEGSLCWVAQTRNEKYYTAFT
jgi:hypothetical protein